jgi:hypothetical protein
MKSRSRPSLPEPLLDRQNRYGLNWHGGLIKLQQAAA